MDDKEEISLTAPCGVVHEVIVQLPLDKEIEVDQVDGKGLTPLTHVGRAGHEEILQ